MKLRIARKIDRNIRRGYRPGQPTYSDQQLEAATNRLVKSWHVRCPIRMDEQGKTFRSLTPDFFASNRVHGMLVRQRALRRVRRERAVPHTEAVDIAIAATINAITDGNGGLR